MRLLSRVPADGVPVLFEARVAAAPDAVAVVSGEVVLSFGELNARANRLARLLVARGVGAEQIVALALPRSVELVVAVLAVLKSGAAYLPVDPDYPAARIAFMLDDARPALLLTTEAVAAELSEQIHGLSRVVVDSEETAEALRGCPDSDMGDTDRLSPLSLQHGAYVIYTSGSTGVPKGVVVSHTGVASLVTAQCERFGVGAGSRVLQFASPSFDASFSELCLGLLGGGALVLARSEDLLPGPSLIALMERQGVTHVTLPPSALSALVAVGGVPGGVTVTVAGEACPPELVEECAPGRRMINAYGPTETTVCATMSRPLTGGTSAVPAIGTPISNTPIGTPISNTQVFVLDAGLRPVPVGTPGGTVCRRCGTRPRVPGPAGTDRSAVRGQSLRSCGIPSLPHRGPRPVAHRRGPRIPRPFRRTGQTTRLPGRTR